MAADTPIAAYAPAESLPLLLLGVPVVEAEVPSPSDIVAEASGLL